MGIWVSPAQVFFLPPYGSGLRFFVPILFFPNFTFFDFFSKNVTLYKKGMFIRIYINVKKFDIIFSKTFLY